jgi:ATP-dependent DNA ligase
MPNTPCFQIKTRTAKFYSHKECNLLAQNMVLKPPLAPASARVAKNFPLGEEWVYELKWDGFRCVLFRYGDQVYLQSRAQKDLTPGFREIVKAARALKPRCFVLDGELAVPTEDGFSLDLLVNRLRLRVTGERFQRELKGYAWHLAKDDPTSSRRRGTIWDWKVISEIRRRQGYVGQARDC